MKTSFYFVRALVTHLLFFTLFGMPLLSKAGVNDTVIINLNQASFNSGFIDIPVSVNSPDTAETLDYSFRFNHQNLTYSSLIPFDTDLFNTIFLNPSDSVLRYSSYTLPPGYVDNSTTLMLLRFQAVQAFPGKAYLYSFLNLYRFKGLINGENSVTKIVTTICNGQSITLTADSCTSCTYLWNNGATTQSINVANPGLYFATITNPVLGITTRSTITQLALNPIPNGNISISGPTTFCEKDSVILTASSTTGTQFVWSNGFTGPHLTVKASGSYSVTIFDSFGCSTVRGPVNVTVNPLPDTSLSYSGPTNFCSGDSVIISANNIPGNSYLWSTGETGASITVKTSGTYSLTITNSFGCVNSPKPIPINANSLPDTSLSPSGSVSICQGDSLRIQAVVVPGYSYLWSDGSTGNSILVKTAGAYSLTINNGGCLLESDPVIVSVNPLPLATVNSSGPLSFCSGGSVTLTAVDSINVSYEWSNGETSRSILVNSSGNYSVTLTNNFGCSATSALLIVSVGTLSADFNLDGFVNTSDYLIFASQFGAFCDNCAQDLNADGVVNTSDYLIFASQFGTSCF